MATVRTTTLVGVGLAAILLAAGVGYALRARGRDVTPTALEAGPAPELATWCGPGLEPIPGGCLALPARPKGARLVVYLHGMYSPAQASIEAERQGRLARQIAGRGFAMLALRGKQGQCSGEAAEWWCWPSNPRTAPAGPEYVASWHTPLAAAESRVGKGARFLLGFSNGGYFASIIATRALMPFDAIAIAHAGSVGAVKADGAKPPIMLLTADDDPSVESMIALDAELSREGWPHAIASREGGHEIADTDLATALAFFERSREAFPLAPPISTRTPRPRVARAEKDASEPGDPDSSEGVPPVDSSE